MRRLLDGEQAKQLDTYSIQTFGMESLILMERAALACSEIIRRQVKGTKVLILSGCGNNGADGLAMARILQEMGYEPKVILLGNVEHVTSEWSYQKALLEKCGIVTERFEEIQQIPQGYDCYVDAIFGIGLKREITGCYREAIIQLNGQSKNAFRLAVDIPSGVDASTGAVLGSAFQADYTVTFGYEKIGLYQYPGHCFCGQIERAAVGFAPFSLLEQKTVMSAETSDVVKLLAKRNPDGNKGTFGQVLIVAGEEGMAGAACFAAEAAYRAGAGLVKVITAQKNHPVLQIRLPEAVLLSDTKEQIKAAIHSAHAIVMGPGMSKSEWAKKIFEQVLEVREKKPLVLDADGLNLLSERKYRLDDQVILTPHPGELARLLDMDRSMIAEQGIRALAKQLCERYGTVSVCKDARTWIRTPDGDEYFNITGNDAMATGGSGDVLAGLLGGLLAQHMEPKAAAVSGVFLHGLAGELAAGQKGHYGTIARDIIERIPEAFMQTICGVREHENI